MIDYSIVIPAFNEEALLPGTLSSVRDCMDAVELVGEVIVVDNNSTDETARVARDHSARVVFEPKNQISRARNRGARAAQGRFLIFVDADTQVPILLFQKALHRLESGRCCGGGVLISFESCDNRVAHRLLEAWNGFSRRRQLAAGCFIFCLRTGFESVSGFSESVYAGEEIWFARKLKRWGSRNGQKFTIITEPRVITSSRKIEWYSTWQICATVLLMILFPLAVHFRSLCSVWYRRP